MEMAQIHISKATILPKSYENLNKETDFPWMERLNMYGKKILFISKILLTLVEIS